VALEKVCLRLSSAALRSLNAFLIEAKASSVLFILNTEFKIEKEKKRDGAEGDGGECDGRAPDLAPLSWRVPGKQSRSCKRCRAWEPRSRRVVKDAEQEVGADGLPDFSKGFFCDLLEGRVLPQLLRSKRGTGAATENMVLPPSGEDVQECEEDVATATLPSVLFATIANTYGDMTCLHVSDDATLAVAGFASSGKVLVWDWDSSHRSARSDSSLAPCQFNSVQPGACSSSIANVDAFSDTVTEVGGGSYRGVWKDRSGEASPTALVGHSQRVYSVSVEGFSGDNRFVLSAAADETVRLWDLMRGRSCTCSSSSECACKSACLARYACSDGIPWSVEFGPFGYHFLVGNQRGTAVLHSTDRLSALRVFRGHTSDVTCSSFHPNAAYVATGSDDGSVRLWDIRDATSGSVRRLCATKGNGGAMSVTAVQCSPCGSLVAAGYDDGTAAVWDIPTGRLTYVLRDETNEPHVDGDTGAEVSTAKRMTQKQIYSMRFDQSTTFLATGGQDCAVKLWDLESASRQSQSRQFSHCLLTPRASFHTKFTPVFSLSGFMSMKSSGTVVVAGGPSSISSECR